MEASSSLLGNQPAGSDDRAFSFHLDRLLSGREDLVFHHQPIVDLSRGVIAGYEALVRFPAAMGRAPDVCFETADSLGRREELESVVARAAILGKNALPANCFLSVNVSPAFLVSDLWLDVVASVSDLSSVVIEITEGESIQDYAFIRTRLAQVRALGASIAVDDAGAGYASLKHVVEMKPQFIKLDRMFIANCQSERAKAALIEMMGRAASRLDAWIIAEGIETGEELDELMQLGVPLGQGYYLGRPAAGMQPLAADKAEAILARNMAHQNVTGLHKHVVPCPVEDSADRATERLAGDEVLSAVVVSDRWNRPVEIIERHPFAGIRRIVEVMKIQVLSDPAEVLHRALTRPAVNRYDPFAVIDHRGEFQGILTVDRLMRAILP